MAIKRGAGRKASGGHGRSWRRDARARPLEGASERKKEEPTCGPRMAVRERGREGGGGLERGAGRLVWAGWGRKGEGGSLFKKKTGSNQILFKFKI